MTIVKISILIHKNKDNNINQIAKILENEGLQIQSKLRRFGIILGLCDDSLLEKFRSMNDIQEVRLQTDFYLPPMDEDIPQ